ncbi:hypothetical protein ATCM_12540 [Stenotrophomonas sp. ATCM1_4]|nr:hypothetical protein ATCM_12540 [Stenotrophomonas sp. ATCM1_4]
MPGKQRTDVMIKKALKTVLFLLVAVSGFATAQVTPCSMCEVQLNRCLQNGVFTDEQCYAAYERCKADACPAP